VVYAPERLELVRNGRRGGLPIAKLGRKNRLTARLGHGSVRLRHFDR
jgi:hypothetical protein